MGGEASKYIRLDPGATGKHLGIVDYPTSGDCAAGTGSFIDQQASRLLYSIEQVGPAACGASCAARIAGRCSVFAKSDMIHAQQKGYTTDQILRGLCDAVARNFKSTIVKGRAVVSPVAFIGGVAINEGVRNALSEAFKLEDGDLLIPEHYAWLGAMGAAMFESEEVRKRSFKRIHQLRQHEAVRKQLLPAPIRFPWRRSCCCEIATEGEEGARRRYQVPERQPGRFASLTPDLTPDTWLRPTWASTSVRSRPTWSSSMSEGNLVKEIYLRTQGRPIEVVDRGLKEIEGSWAERSTFAAWARPARGAN